jgi:hypothetical protein
MVLYSIHANAAAVSGTFPEYDSIRPNISFWKKIYTQYPTTNGVIHDKRNLGIIYEVIELKDRNHHGSRKINRDRIKKAKKKYKLILAKLARGEPPKGSEEKRVGKMRSVRASFDPVLIWHKSNKFSVMRACQRNYPICPMWNHLLTPKPTVNLVLPASGNLPVPPANDL